jgi:tRNA(fMet)-specific endonuclease VapC
MSLFILDTDIVSLYQRGHPQVLQRVSSQPSTTVAITLISVQEQLDGRRGLLARATTRLQIARAYLFFADVLLPVLRQFEILTFSEDAILRYEQLLALKLNVGRMDLRIGAIALENKAIVVTRNQRDFGRIPGLTLEDWSV